MKYTTNNKTYSIEIVKSKIADWPIRAIMLTENKKSKEDWIEIYTDLYKESVKNNLTLDVNGILKKYLTSNGYSFELCGKANKITLAEFVDSHLTGIYIIHLDHRIEVVIDGIIYTNRKYEGIKIIGDEYIHTIDYWLNSKVKGFYTKEITKIEYDSYKPITNESIRKFNSKKPYSYMMDVLTPTTADNDFTKFTPSDSLIRSIMRITDRANPKYWHEVYSELFWQSVKIHDIYDSIKNIEKYLKKYNFSKCIQIPEKTYISLDEFISNHLTGIYLIYIGGLHLALVDGIVYGNTRFNNKDLINNMPAIDYIFNNTYVHYYFEKLN